MTLNDAQGIELFPGSTPYNAIMDEAEAYYGLPDYLLYTIAQRESKFNPNVTNWQGCAGLFQFAPNTYRALKINPYNANSAIWAAAKYLRFLYDKYFQDWSLTVLAWNWGPGNVRRFVAGNKPLASAAQKYLTYVDSIVYLNPADIPQEG